MFGLLLVFAVSAFAQDQPFYNNDFSGGLNTYNSSLLINQNESPDLQNVLIDQSGSLNRRKGYVKVNTTAIGSGASDVNYLFDFEPSNGTHYCVAFSSASGYFSTDRCQTFTSFVSTLTVNNDVDCDQLNDVLVCVNNQYNFSFTGLATTQKLNGDPSSLKIIKQFNNQCFATGSTGNLSRLYYSNINDCTTWNTITQYVDIAPGNGETITGLGDPFYGGLPIYKNNSTWYLTQVGSGPNGPIFQVINISHTIGAKNHRSIQTLGPEQLFDSLGSNGGQPGIYAFDGIKVYEKTKKIRSAISSLGNFSTTNNYFTFNTYAQWAAGTFDPMTMSATRQLGLIQSSATTVTDNVFNGTLVNVSTNDTTFPSNLVLLRSTWSTVNGNFGQNSLNGWTGSGWIADNSFMTGDGCAAIELSSSTSARLTTNIGTHQFFLNVLDPSNNIIKSCSTSIGCDGVTVCGVNSTTCDFFQSSGTISGSGNTKLVGVNISNASNYGGFQLQFSMDGSNLTSTVAPPAAQIWVLIGATNFAGTSLVEAKSCALTNYLASGSYTSPIFDTAISTPVGGPFTVTESSATDASVTFQAQASTSTTGTFSSLVTATPGQIPVIPGYEFYRYKATFANTTSTKTANVSSVSEAFVATGTWTSPETFLDNAMSGWNLFQVNETITGNAAIAFSIRASTYTGGTAFSVWTPITPGNSISIATGAYVQITSTFTITSSTETSSLANISINWTDGIVSRTPASSVFQNRYHYAGQSPSSMINDTMYIMDINGSWVKWNDVFPRSLAVINQNLMMGHSTTTVAGFIHQMYTSDSDNGGPINAYYNTKDMPLGDVVHIKAVDRVILAYGSNATNLNLDILRDTNLGDTLHTFNTNTSSLFGVNYFVVEPPLNGNTFRLKFSNNAVNAPWSVLGYGLTYTDVGMMQPF